MTAKAFRLVYGDGRGPEPPPEIYEVDGGADTEREVRFTDDADLLGTSATGQGNRHSEVGELGEWDAGDDDYCIPPRGWLFGSTFCRRVVRRSSALALPAKRRFASSRLSRSRPVGA